MPSRVNKWILWWFSILTGALQAGPYIGGTATSEEWRGSLLALLAVVGLLVVPMLVGLVTFLRDQRALARVQGEEDAKRREHVQRENEVQWRRKRARADVAVEAERSIKRIERARIVRSATLAAFWAALSGGIGLAIGWSTAALLSRALTSLRTEHEPVERVGDRGTIEDREGTRLDLDLEEVPKSKAGKTVGAPPTRDAEPVAAPSGTADSDEDPTERYFAYDDEGRLLRATELEHLRGIWKMHLDDGEAEEATFLQAVLGETAPTIEFGSLSGYRRPGGSQDWTTFLETTYGGCKGAVSRDFVLGKKALPWRERWGRRFDYRIPRDADAADALFRSQWPLGPGPNLPDSVECYLHHSLSSGSDRDAPPADNRSEYNEAISRSRAARQRLRHSIDVCYAFRIDPAASHRPSRLRGAIDLAPRVLLNDRRPWETCILKGDEWVMGFTLVRIAAAEVEADHELRASRPTATPPDDVKELVQTKAAELELEHARKVLDLLNEPGN
jgi:hypothetical protein